jgi:phage gpG-like protein
MQAKISQPHLKALNKKISRLKGLSEQELSNAVTAIAFDAARKAKQTVVVDNGDLKRSISASKVDKNTVAYKAGVKYAPYVEYGTGSRVNLSEMEELGIPASYAAQFKGKGIKEVNLPARPFFFSSLRIALAKGMIDINNRIKKLTK